jgi:uncharacterized membrane protein
MLETKKRSWNFLVIVLLLQFVVLASVFLDLFGVRQIVGVLYLTFVPGLIVVKLLKLDELGSLETILLSVGFSLTSLMVVALILNEFGPMFGFSQPLSLNPLLITFSVLTLLGAVLVCLRNANIKLQEVTNRDIFLSVLLIGLPILSVIGTIWASAYGNNSILLFSLLAIPLVPILGVVSKKLLPPKLYPIAIFMMAISLLYSLSLYSNLLTGYDVQLEYFVAKNTQNDAYWSSISQYTQDLTYGKFNSMLSVSVLPTVYSTLLNIDISWVFKIVFPLIFALVPVGLYHIWKDQIGKKYAFISAFLFLSYETFYTEMLSLNRQMIGELFFVLLLFVILNKKMSSFNKTVCFIVFSFGIIVSHYALSEIFLIFVVLTFVELLLFKQQSRNINATMILSFFVMMFMWYIYTSNAAVFSNFVDFANYISSRLDEFFRITSRESTVLKGLGLESARTFWKLVSRLIAYTTQFLITVGFIGLIMRWRKNRSNKRDYGLLSFTAFGFLVALILVPGLSNTMHMTRFYHILLFFLAPFCVMGAQLLLKLVTKRKLRLKVSLLMLVILVPYFLFQTNFVYEVTGSDSWSIPLSKSTMDPLRLYGKLGYVDTQSAFGAQWLAKYVDVERTPIYADAISQDIMLVSYGMTHRGYVEVLSNTTTIANGGAVYLNSLNVAEGEIIGRTLSWNSTDLSSLFSNLNKIYTNGDSEIYSK